MVGIQGIVVNSAALFVLYERVHVPFLIAAVLSSQVSTLSNFVLTELWVFRAREIAGSMLWRYLTFNALNLVTQLIRLPTLQVLTEIGGVHTRSPTWSRSD